MFEQSRNMEINIHLKVTSTAMPHTTTEVKCTVSRVWLYRTMSITMHLLSPTHTLTLSHIPIWCSLFTSQTVATVLERKIQVCMMNPLTFDSAVWQFSSLVIYMSCFDSSTHAIDNPWAMIWSWETSSCLLSLHSKSSKSQASCNSWTCTMRAHHMATNAVGNKHIKASPSIFTSYPPQNWGWWHRRLLCNHIAEGIPGFVSQRSVEFWVSVNTSTRWPTGAGTSILSLAMLQSRILSFFHVWYIWWSVILSKVGCLDHNDLNMSATKITMSIILMSAP